MEITRTIEIDLPVDDVWRVVADPDELATWVGDDVRNVPLVVDPDRHRVAWTWAPDGVDSIVEIEVVDDGDGASEVHVTERTAGPATASARACSLARWDCAALALDVLLVDWRARSWTHRLVAA